MGGGNVLLLLRVMAAGYHVTRFPGKSSQSPVPWARSSLVGRLADAVVSERDPRKRKEGSARPAMMDGFVADREFVTNKVTASQLPP